MRHSIPVQSNLYVQVVPSLDCHKGQMAWFVDQHCEELRPAKANKHCTESTYIHSTFSVKVFASEHNRMVGQCRRPRHCEMLQQSILRPPVQLQQIAQQNPACKSTTRAICGVVVTQQMLQHSSHPRQALCFTSISDTLLCWQRTAHVMAQ